MDHPPLVLASAVRGHRPGGRHHLVAAPRHPRIPALLAVRGRYDEADAIVKQLEANGSEPIDAAAKADTSDTRNAGGRSLGICLLVAVVAVAATNVCSYAFTSWVPTILVKRGINLSSSLLTSTVMMLGAPSAA